MDIDLDRWQSLLAAYADSVDSSPPFMRLQTAQQTWARSKADLETFEARGAGGQRDRRNPDLEATYKRSVAELEQRVASAAAEVRRISALQQQSSARRNALRQLVDGVRQWAMAQSPPINLPGGGDDVTGMIGFAESSVNFPSAAGREPFGMTSVRG
jgi:uncharacterized small protein (DUF1192 family)